MQTSQHVEPGIYLDSLGRKFRVLLSVHGSTDPVVVFSSLEKIPEVFTSTIGFFTEIIQWPSGDYLPRFFAEFNEETK